MAVTKSHLYAEPRLSTSLIVKEFDNSEALGPGYCSARLLAYGPWFSSARLGSTGHSGSSSDAETAKYLPRQGDALNRVARLHRQDPSRCVDCKRGEGELVESCVQRWEPFAFATMTVPTSSLAPPKMTTNSTELRSTSMRSGVSMRTTVRLGSKLANRRAMVGAF